MATFLGFLVALGTLIVAAYQLIEQRKSVELNGKVNSLIQMSNMIQNEINRHEAILQSIKEDNEKCAPGQTKDWSPLANKINAKLRPLLVDTNKELLVLLKKQNPQVVALKMERLLNLDKK